jgi:hypothetical protein
MKSISGGNGSGKFEIGSTNMGGWVRVAPGKAATYPDDLPVFLSHALTAWFRERPQLRMRSVLPVSRNGDTVELHAWFDQHVFPDQLGQEPKPT